MLDKLKSLLGPGKVLDHPLELHAYSYDASRRTQLPFAVVNVLEVTDVVKTVQFAANNGFRLVARGAATGLTGGSVPVDNSIVVNFERMDKILEIDLQNRVAVVEPGVINSQLQAALAGHGLFFACDPGSNEYATVGGNVAENACGLRGRRYGSAHSQVAGLEYVDARACLVRTGWLNGGQNRLLESLIVASEGTLGLITKVAINLHVAPKNFYTILLYFSKSAKALDFAQHLLGQGILPITLEYIGGEIYSKLVQPSNTDLSVPEVGAVLFIENPLDNGDSLTTAFLQQAVAESPSFKTLVASSPDQRQTFWDLRRSISQNLYKLAPAKVNEDVGVPVSQIHRLVPAIHELAAMHQLPVYLFGHLAVGCIHVNFMFDPAYPGTLKRVEQAVQCLFKITMELGGTLSSEHGIGLSKKEFMPLEFSALQLDLLKKIKQVMDPLGIFNPGKIL